MYLNSPFFLRPLINSLRNVYLFSLSGANSELDNQSLPEVAISPSLLKTLSQVRIGVGDVQVGVCRCVHVQPWVLFFRSHHMCMCRGGVRGCQKTTSGVSPLETGLSGLPMHCVIVYLAYRLPGNYLVPLSGLL